MAKECDGIGGDAGLAFGRSGRQFDAFALARYKEAAGMKAMGPAYADRVKKKMETVTGLSQRGSVSPW